MTPTLTALGQAARLSNCGISILLIHLGSARGLDKLLGRKLPLAGAPLEKMEWNAITIALLLGIAQAVPYALHQTHRLWHWPDADQIKLTRMVGLWMYGAVRVVVVQGLAYHPRRKMIWCAGWVFTSHIIILGALWTQVR